MPGRPRPRVRADVVRPRARSRSSIVSRRRISVACSVAHEHGRRAGDAVVVRRHRERVGAGRGHRQEIAATRSGESDVVDQHVARLAVHPGDADALVARLVGAAGRERRVHRVVELRPRVVGHAAVDRDPRALGQPLDGADPVERHTRSADERAARLEPDLGLGQAGLRERRSRRLDRARRQLGRVRGVLVRVVADPEAATEIGDPRRPAERVATRRGERGEPHDRLGLGVEVGELRADVDVEPEHVEAARERILDQRPRLRGRKAELRAVMPGPDRLVRVGVDAERDAHEARAARRQRRQALPRPVHRARPSRPRRPASARKASSLLLPWTTISSPRNPAARAKASSPVEATSTPRPSSRRSRSTATFGNAFVPKATWPPATAARRDRARARSVASQ